MVRAKKKSKSKEIVDFLYETGFILELEACEFLEKQGYEVEPSQYFYDADERKKREIDLIARKTVNDVTICLVIECKQNLGDDWVFIRTQKDPQRWYDELKHSPQIPTDVLKTNEEYNELHIYDFKLPLAQNYLIYKSEKGKKVKIEPLQIRECIHKLPKAVAWVAKGVSETRTVYYPVALFSGKIFVANYDGKLLVKERMAAQIQTVLESAAYTVDAPAAVPIDRDGATARENLKKLGRNFAIDFISRKGLKRYLKLIEKEISSLDTSLWRLQKKES